MVRILTFLLICLIHTYTAAAEPSFKESRYKSSSKLLRRTLLITGCSRSGTTYISKVLQLCQLDIKHEKLGKDGISSWPMAVDATESPWGPPAYGIRFKHVFHQVRHPLLVISSVYTTELPASWDFIMKQIPQIKESDPLVVRCAKYWYFWNLAAEEKAEWTYRIENLDQVFEEMSRRLGIPLDPANLHCIPRDCNHRKDYIHKFTWEDLRQQLPRTLFHRVQKLAVRYGYSLEELGPTI